MRPCPIYSSPDGKISMKNAKEENSENNSNYSLEKLRKRNCYEFEFFTEAFFKKNIEEMEMERKLEKQFGCLKKRNRFMFS
jgi:hypothetical protein